MAWNRTVLYNKNKMCDTNEFAPCVDATLHYGQLKTDETQAFREIMKRKLQSL